MDALFEDGDEVEISSLRQKFRARLESVQQALYEEVVAQGWYRRSPQSTRTRWLAVGLVALVASVALFVAAVVWTKWAIVPIPIMVGAIALIAGHNPTPARTGNGIPTHRRTPGFDRLLS